MQLSERVTANLARQLVKDYGDDAETAARDRAEALAAYGNSEAAQVWAQVFDILTRRRSRP
jgi:hypothetical protein